MKNCLITLNYNDYETTHHFATNVAKYQCVDFLVIVDNNSDDNSYEKLKELTSEKVIIVKSEKNGGYSYGNNYGFKVLKARFGLDFNLVISNPDIEISESDLEQLFNCVANSEGVVGPTIIEGDSLNRGHKVPTVFDDILLNIPFLSKTVFKSRLEYKNSYYCEDATKVGFVSGSVFGISARLFDSIGMLDENVFLYYEENILAKRLEKINKDVYVLNNVKAIHHHSISIDKVCSSYKKLRVLKASQYYFHSNYSNASKFSLMILKLSINSLLKLYAIRYGAIKDE